ncbi:MAG TPA: hypothetical protein VFY23_02555 [Candidatus Limnocylindrales bacterium]|nr:hypothetical protein [Candidatus Limnocylindrales bacterium]
MRFLRRGGGDAEQPPPLEQRLDAFWAWWAGARDGITADIERGAVAGRAAEISEAVNRLHEKLAWELSPGSAARHALVVSPEGNPELRPIALRWAESAPPADASWEYHPSRQPGPPQVLEIRGARVSFSEVRSLTSWDASRELLTVRIWHPALDGLPSDVKAQIAFLFLDNLVGEDDVERWIGAIEADPEAAAGQVPDALRDEVRRRASESTGDQWALIEARDGRGDPVLIRLNSSLKRIDHPFAGDHLAVVIERGLDAAGDTGEREAIDRAETELVQALDGLAIEAAHITDRRRRVTHLVTADGDRALAAAREWASGHEGWGATASLEPDPAWSFRRAYGG